MLQRVSFSISVDNEVRELFDGQRGEGDVGLHSGGMQI